MYSLGDQPMDHEIFNNELQQIIFLKKSVIMDSKG